MLTRRRRSFTPSSLLLISVWLVACGPKPDSEVPEASPAAAVDPAALELEARLAHLEAQLEQARVDAHVPGMAVAVVKDDELIFAKGFGVTNVEAGTPVTPETVFAIGSSTKAFSSALAAMMVDEGKLGWDDPVAKHLPGFNLQVDGAEGDVATVRDLLSHRSGFARMGVLWAGNSATRDEILAFASKAEPVAPFRAEFHYNNVTYMAGALAAAAAAESTWEDLVRTRLLEPLHMDHSSVDFRGAMADPNRATGYTWRADLDALELAPPRSTDAIAPAGSIYSSVLDMSNWLRLLLGEGEFEGQRLVSAEALAQTQTSQIEMGPDMGYGMGWMLHEWNGKQVVEHGGNIDGYAASVALLPEAEIGVVVLTNVGMTSLQSSGMNMVFDALLTDAYLPAAETGTGEDMDRFVGNYVAEIPGFGGEPFEVSIKDGKLAVNVPGQTNYLLEPPDPDDEEGLRAFEATDTIAVSFDESPEGEVVALRLHQNGMAFELLREGYEPEPEVTPGEAAAVLGSYRDDDKGMVVTVVLHHGRLALDVPGQMVFDLTLADPSGDHHFRANADFTVSFTRDDQGNATKLSLVQPGGGGVFTREQANKASKAVTLADVHRIRKSDKRAKALAKAGIIHLRQTVSMPSAGVTGTGEVWFDPQGQLRQETDFGPLGTALVILHGDEDGDGGWADSAFEPRKALTGVELRQARLDHPRFSAGDWRQGWSEETLLRTTTGEDGREVHVIELRAPDVPPSTVHVDAKTGDIVEVHQVEVTGSGLRIPIVVKLSDYKVVKGMRLAHRIESSNPHSGRMVIVLDAIETKVADDPARFVAMPRE